MAPTKRDSTLALCQKVTTQGNSISIRMLEYLSTTKRENTGFQGLATDFLDLCRELWSIEAGLTDAATKRSQLPSDMTSELEKRFRQVHEEFIVLNQLMLKLVDGDKKHGFMKGLRMMFADTDVEKMHTTICKSRDALRMSSSMFRWSLGDAKSDAAMGIGYTGLMAALDRMNGVSTQSTHSSTALPPMHPPPSSELPEPPLQQYQSSAQSARTLPSLPPVPLEDYDVLAHPPSTHSSHPVRRQSSIRTGENGHHALTSSQYRQTASSSNGSIHQDSGSDNTMRSRTNFIDDHMHDLHLNDVSPINTMYRADTFSPLSPQQQQNWPSRQTASSKTLGGKGALLNAVQNKQYRVLENLLDGGARMDSRAEAGMLRAAAENRDAEALNLLLRGGLDANGFDKDEITPLFAVTQASFFEGAKILLRHGADPNLAAGNESESPLALAVTENRIDLVALYLKHGGDPNFVMASGDTALVHAMNKRTSSQVLELLLQSGGDANAKNGEGTTALFAAIQANRLDLMTYLLDHGANPNLPGPKHPLWPSAYKPKALELLLARGANPKKAPGIMELASSLKKLESISILIRAGVSPNEKKDGVYTPLCSAIRDNSAEIVTYLLENGADPNVPSAEYSHFKCLTHHRIHFLPQLVAAGVDLHTPKGIIEAAVANNEKDAVTFFLDHGVSPNDRNADGHTALTTAIREDRMDFVDLLLSRGADVAVRGEEWPLCMAVKRPHILKKLLAATPNPRAFRGVVEMAVVANELESIKLLLAAGVSVEDKNCGVFSPLTTAIRERHKPIVRYLLDEADADPNAPGEHLPLVKALRRLEHNDVEVLTMLLTRGADINKMYRGWNPILQAVENGDAAVLKLLIDKGGPVDLNAVDEEGRKVADVAVEKGWEEGLALLFPKSPGGK